MIKSVDALTTIDPTNLPPYLQEAVERLRAAFGSDLVGIALYGSRARGEARPDSDVDLLAIVRNLPKHWQERAWVLHNPLKDIEANFPFYIFGKTPEEFESGFPSIYLDMGLDGIVLYDPEGYLTQKLARIREIISEVGLVRERIAEGEFFWDWKRQITYPWELDWEGLREGTR